MWFVRLTAKKKYHLILSYFSYLILDPFNMVTRLDALRKGKVQGSRKMSIMGPPGKKIIKGVSAYFNPGQLVAIMGPSGSGKTTLLDVLTARRHLKEAEVSLFIN